MKIQENVALAPLTSWKVGGPAQYFCQPETIDEVRQALHWAQSQSKSQFQKVRISVLSGGTNVLVADEGVCGLVICLNKLSGITTIQSHEQSTKVKVQRVGLRALAGTSKSELLKFFLQKELSPALFLAGLPGDVGGGVVMNAGIGEITTPHEFGEIVDVVRVMREDGQIVEIQSQDIQWAYRKSAGWQPGIIVEVTMSWPNQKVPGIRDQVRNLNKERAAKQPLDMPSCGSVFQNPPEGKAGKIIQDCGLKGARRGQAQVSEKHANFIVNLGGATCADILGLIQHVQAEVLRQRQISLKTEVILMTS